MNLSSLPLAETIPLRKWDCNGQAALSNFNLPAGCQLQLLSLSENATYLVTEPGSRRRHILRLHRPGYRSRAEIESELTWITAIQAQSIAQTPPVIRTQNDQMVAEFRDVYARTQHAVLFAHIDGASPEEDNLCDAFRQVGAISADLHRHSQNWQQPTGFTRPVWDEESAIGINGHWGYWRNNADVGLTEARLLEQLDTELRKQLATYGRPAERYGLIHGDMRQTNLLVKDGKVNVIDFDDSGFSWHLYELACSLSFIEANPQRDAFTAAWLDGYRTGVTLNREDLAIIPALVMLRRLLLVGWFSTHQHTTEARELKSFVPDSLEMAELFLTGDYLRAGINN